MRTLSLFFVPALAMTYFAGTQHAHAWSFALLGGAGCFLFLLIREFYRIALDAPVGLGGLQTMGLETVPLGTFLNEMDPESETQPNWPIYVATKASGIVPAHDVYTARFDGQKVVIIGSDARAPQSSSPGTDFAGY